MWVHCYLKLEPLILFYAMCVLWSKNAMAANYEKWLGLRDKLGLKGGDLKDFVIEQQKQNGTRNNLKWIWLEDKA